MNDRVPMTVEGHAGLQDELANLKSVERPKVIAAIAEARAHGDLKENAEYHAAREQQGFIEARIKDIEGKISNAQVIDPSKLNANGKVIFGATVTLINSDTEETVVYQIVGEDEADIKLSKISHKSPIAKAIIGKEEGEVATVITPKGEQDYEVEKVEYIQSSRVE